MIQEMYAEIQKQTNKHSVSELCEIYGVSRSGYYKWLKRAGQLNRYEKTHQILDSYVLDIHSHHPMMGSARSGTNCALNSVGSSVILLFGSQ